MPEERAEVEGPRPADHGVESAGAEGFAHDPALNALMEEALALARPAASAGDVPVGALVVSTTGEVIGRGMNTRVAQSDPAGHAEVTALREAAARLGTERLDGCTLLATLEPCAMCAGAAMGARMERIVFGAWDTKAGACGSVWDLPRDPRALHRIDVVGGVRADDCAEPLHEFFRSRRSGRPSAGAAQRRADER